MGIFKMFCEPFQYKIPACYGSFVVYDGYLTACFNIPKIKENYLGTWLGTSMNKAMANTRTLFRQNDYYRQEDIQQMLFGNDTIAWKLSKFMGMNHANYSVKRYFDAHQDNAHRADLAFAMIQLAERANSFRVKLQRVADPDLWWIAETSEGITIHFAGMAYNFGFDGLAIADPADCEIRFREGGDCD